MKDIMESIRNLATGLVILAVLILAAGCNTNKGKPKAGGKNSEEESHVHGTGPHGGTIADWGGGKYHIEFTVNHEKQEATVYILGTGTEMGASRQLVEQRPGVLQVGGVKPLGEPAVDLCQHLARFVLLALFL